MPKTKKPRRGSMQYWPRKRAMRIYPVTSFWHNIKETKPLGFAAWKAGMTHVQYADNNSNSVTYGKTVTKAVTILDAAPLLVCALRYYKNKKAVGEKWIEKLPEGIVRKKGVKKAQKNIKEINAVEDVRLVVSTQPDKSAMRKKKADIFEVAVGGEAERKKTYAESLLGKELHAEDIFKPGETVDVSAVTKGHGFTGPVKRFGIRIQTRKNEQHHRHVGATGTEGLRKMDWRVPAAGQHGFQTRTETGKKILMINNDAKKIIPKGGLLNYGNPRSFMLIEGSVPGPRKRLIRLRKTQMPAAPVEVSYISLAGKQGR